MTPQEIRLDNQVAVVTGGANGIGESAVMALAQCGADIVIADVDAKNAERVATAVRGLGRQVLFVPTDVLHADQITAMVEQAAEHFGHIDILINNAGGTRHQWFLDQGERNWRRLIDFNLVSTLAATHAVAKVMIAGGKGGTIVNIASTESMRAAPGFAVYAACKAAMVSFTRTMALELAPHGIRVNALAPDMIMTPGLQAFFDGQPKEELEARDRYVPLGRPGTMEEMGNVILFLASPMSSYLNGVAIPVDAGALASSGWNRTKDGKDWVLYHA